MRLCVTIVGIVLLVAARAVAAEESGHVDAAPVYQLRVYEIFEANKGAFHDRFRDHAARIMKRYDFDIVAMWEAKGTRKTEFVYLLVWPDVETRERQWAAFMADAEWAEIKRRTGAVHGDLVGDIEDRALLLTTYSPDFPPAPSQ